MISYGIYKIIDLIICDERVNKMTMCAKTPGYLQTENTNCQIPEDRDNILPKTSPCTLVLDSEVQE